MKRLLAMAGLFLSGLCAACSSTGVGMGAVGTYGLAASSTPAPAAISTTPPAFATSIGPGREAIYTQYAGLGLGGSAVTTSRGVELELTALAPKERLQDDRAAVLAITRGQEPKERANLFTGPIRLDSTAASSGLQALTVAPAAGREALVQAMVDSNVRPWLSQERRVGGELTLAAPIVTKRGSIDVSLTPRAEFVDGFGNVSAKAGAEFRVGQNLLQGDGPQTGWYLFAAADGEAITWDVAGQGMDFMEGVKVGDRVSVGDIQAGVSTAMAGGQLSFSYVRREFSYEDREATEDGAAIAFTLRR
jgi:hypothetical protein